MSMRFAHGQIPRRPADRRDEATRLAAEPLEARQLFNAGSGLFLPESIPVPGNWILAADFNRDGRPDLVTGSPVESSSDYAFGGTVSVLLRGDDGRFNTSQSPFIGQQFRGLIAADLTSDQIPDLAAIVTVGTTTEVRVFRGRGDGTFSPATRKPVSAACAELRVADFNGDGRLDLATRDEAGDQILVYLQRPGGFDSARKTVVPGQSYYTHRNNWTSGDFNGDGKVDLAVTVRPDYFEQIAILPGLGNGRFSKSLLLLPEDPNVLYETVDSLIAADLDGDQRDDLLVSSSYSGSDGWFGWHGTSTVLLRNGGGSFKEVKELYHSSDSGIDYFPTVADLDRDGWLDVVIDNLVLMGRGDGQFRQTPLRPLGNAIESLDYFSGPSDPHDETTGGLVVDFDGDGALDLVGGGDGRLDVVYGRGDGTFALSPAYSLSIATNAVVADFNDDGLDDIGSSAGSVVMVSLCKGDGRFTAPTSYDLPDWSNDIVTGDFNRDGHLDLLTANRYSDKMGDGPGSLSLLLGRGDGRFAPARNWLVEIDDVETADVNGDKLLDIVGRSADGIAVLLGRGNGRFSDPIQTAQPFWNFTLADFNGDGRADVAGTQSYDSTQITVVLGERNGRFAQPRTIQSPSGIPQSVSAADFNGDGRLDLLVTGEDKNLYYLQGLQGARFGAARKLFEGYFYDLRDITGDGRIDLITSGMTIRAGKPDGTFDLPVAYNMISPLFGRFNHDNRLDVVERTWNGYVIPHLNHGTPPSGRGTLAGTVYDDRNSNGRRDAGEKGQSGQVVFIDLNQDGRLNHDEPRAVTNSNGAYRLTRLIPGQQVLRLQSAAGWRQTRPTGGRGHVAWVFSDQVMEPWNFGVTKIGV